ncbi:MAG: ATP-binding protein [Crocosphaera sp.]
MKHSDYPLEEVFIPVGVPKTTRVKRDELERSMKSWELSRAKHLLIFGPSKSGKTTLWKGYVSNHTTRLAEKDIIKIACNSSSTVEKLYTSILFELNQFYSSEQTKQEVRNSSLASELRAILPTFQASLRGTQGESQSTTEKSSRLSNPVLDANTVIKFLRKTPKIIVLEDFHYTNENFKKLLAQDLKAFSDEQCPWIIIGVKRRASEILPYNMDLGQRIFEIPVEWFNPTQIGDIIELGEFALNIRFSPEIKKAIITESLGSASIAQNICLRICIMEEINQTQDKTRRIEQQSLFAQACHEIVRYDSNNKEYYQNFINKVCSEVQINFPCKKFRWLFKFINANGIPDQGLNIEDLYKGMLNLGLTETSLENFKNGLTELMNVLKKQDDFPLLFEFENNHTFYLLDKYMKFVFKWSPDIVDDLFR